VYLNKNATVDVVVDRNRCWAVDRGSVRTLGGSAGIAVMLTKKT
jgi:hypothetical protein